MVVYLIADEKLFTTIGKHIVEAFVEGYNSTIFAYGQTGSGKTYTMLGPDSDATNFGALFENRGLIPRCVEYLFELLEQKEEHVKYTLKCSFVELYNEAFYDLLDLKSNRLKLRSPNSQSAFVEGAIEKSTTSVKQILDTIQTGWSNRRIAETAMNREGSRSHAIFIINFESSEPFKNGVNKKSSKLHLIDLAGSERQKSSKAEGERLKEACHINSSLFNLGRVLRLIGGKPPFVSYRDTLLTQLLKDALGGNSRTAVIVNVHPNHKFFEETHSTLKFAKELKKVKNKAKINQEFFCELENLTRTYETRDQDVEIHKSDNLRIKELEEENGILQRKLQEHRDAISQLLKLNSELEEKLEGIEKAKKNNANDPPQSSKITHELTFPSFETEILKEQLLELVNAFSSTKYELEGDLQSMRADLETTRQELGLLKSTKAETLVLDVDTKPKTLESGLDALEIEQESARSSRIVGNQNPPIHNRNDHLNRSTRLKHDEFSSRRRNGLFSSLILRP
uniref:Kinesin-like protein n=1 Tax=Acrobeloides nanus TaxID=290746 RepID=A0A914BUT2_9BILA